MAAGTPRDRSRSDAIAGLSVSAAAASHASDAQNEHLNNNDEEEPPPCQRRRVGTSRRDMPLAANDSLEGEGGVDEGTSRRDMPLALADDALEREGGVDNVGDGEWIGSIEDLMDEVDNEDEEEEQGGGWGDWEQQWCRCQGLVSWLWMIMICLLIFYRNWRR